MHTMHWWVMFWHHSYYISLHQSHGVNIVRQIYWNSELFEPWNALCTVTTFFFGFFAFVDLGGHLDFFDFLTVTPGGKWSKTECGDAPGAEWWTMATVREWSWATGVLDIGCLVAARSGAVSVNSSITSSACAAISPWHTGTGVVCDLGRARRTEVVGGVARDRRLNGGVLNGGEGVDGLLWSGPLASESLGSIGNTS